jgi:hypothetical protein
MESPETLTARTQLDGRLKNGANWYFWIAGLSLANSVILLAGAKWTFVVGLGVTQYVDLIASFWRKSFGHDVLVSAAALGLNAVVAGVFVLFGVYARRRRAWAFVVGITLYALDGAVLGLLGELWSVAFHGLMLWWLVGGLRASRALARLERETGESAGQAVK